MNIYSIILGVMMMTALAAAESSPRYLGEADPNESILHTVNRCSKEPWVDICLKKKMIYMLDEAVSNGPEEIEVLGELLTLTKNPEVKQDQSLISELSRKARSIHSHSEANDELNELMVKGAVNFIQSRSLNFKLSEWFTPVETSDGVDEARKKIKIKKIKKKDWIKYFFLAVLFKATVMPLIIGKLTLITGKALLISMMALLLATVISFKKGHSRSKSYEINLVPVHSYHHRRNDQEEEDANQANDLAYRNQIESSVR